MTLILERRYIKRAVLERYANLSDVWPKVERGCGLLGTLYSVSADVYAEVKVICRGRCFVCKWSKARILFTLKVNCFKF